MKSRNIKWVVGAVAAAALVAACGGGSSAPVVVAGADAVVPVAAPIAAAVVNTPFSFETGVAALGTTAATTIAFTSTSTSPAFNISSGGNSATGTTNFGSCIFVVASSNFPAGHPLSNGQTVTVNPCSINVATSGQASDGVARPRTARLQLGGTTSNGTSVAVTVNTNGAISINNTSAGTVTLVQVSG